MEHLQEKAEDLEPSETVCRADKIQILLTM